MRRIVCLAAMSVILAAPSAFGQTVTRHSSDLRLTAPANARWQSVRTRLEVTSNVPFKLRLQARNWKEPWHPSPDVYADSHKASWDTITANTRAELEVKAVDQSGRTQTKHVSLGCGTVTKVSFTFESIPLQLPNSVTSQVTVPADPNSVIVQKPTPVTVLPSPVVIEQPPAQHVEVPCKPVCDKPCCNPCPPKCDKPCCNPPEKPEKPEPPDEAETPPTVIDWATLKLLFWIAALLLVLTLCVYSYWKWKVCKLWREELCMRQRRPRLQSSGHAHVVGAPSTGGVDAALGSGFHARPEDTLGG